MTTPSEPICTCPSGDGSLAWPCPEHPPAIESSPLVDWEEVELIMRSAQTLALAVHFKQPKPAQDKARENLRAKVLAVLAQIAADARAQALEQAAKVCDRLDAEVDKYPSACAAAIRGLMAP